MSAIMDKLRINLGSGQRKFGSPQAPWVNVDCNPKWEPDIVASGDSLPMFLDGSADVVVLHHVLEHFGSSEAEPLVKECWRILEPGGSLIITIPDLRELALGWLNGKISDWIYFTNLYGAWMGNEADRHKAGYSMTSLQEFLHNCASWSRVGRFDWREIPGASVAKDWWILDCEAVK